MIRWLNSCDSKVEFEHTPCNLKPTNDLRFEIVRHTDRFVTRVRILAKRCGLVHNGVVRAWIDVDDIDLYQSGYRDHTDVAKYLVIRIEAKYFTHQIRRIWGLSYAEKI